MRSRIDTFLNAIIALAAATLAVVVLRREFRNTDVVRDVPSQSEQLTYVEQWPELLKDGLHLEPLDAAVRLVEFTDFECPFCAEWHRTVLKDVLARYLGNVALTIVHLPIPTHRFAQQAAVGAECSAAQGQLATFIDAVYTWQDSIGFWPWSRFARISTVPDSAQFAHCMQSSVPARITAGRSWAQRLEVFATPTIIVNGWRLPRTPTAEELARLVDTPLSGGSPIAAVDARR